MRGHGKRERELDEVRQPIFNVWLQAHETTGERENVMKRDNQLLMLDCKRNGQDEDCVPLLVLFSYHCSNTFVDRSKSTLRPK